MVGQNAPFSSSKEISRISEFIRKQVLASRRKGIVVAISGGVDSAVASALCVKALGPGKVLGVFMFEEKSMKSRDREDAKKLAKQLGLNTLDLPLTPTIRAFEHALKSRKIGPSKITLANIKARSRMVFLYAIANQCQYLVCGTSDKSEILLGYFTKYGDGAADFEPISHLYKSEVRALATALKLPLEIVNKPASPNLWKNQTASEELPADYDVLDPVLTALFDLKLSPREVANKLSVPLKLVDDVIEMNKLTEHKRQVPISVPQSSV